MSDQECKHLEFRCILASPWQDLEDGDEPDTFNIVAEGETLEYQCDDCGHIWRESVTRYDLRLEVTP